MSQTKPTDLASLLTFDAFRAWMSSLEPDYVFCVGTRTGNCLVARFAQHATGDKRAWAASVSSTEGFVKLPGKFSHKHDPECTTIIARWMGEVIINFDKIFYGTPTAAMVREKMPEYFL